MALATPPSGRGVPSGVSQGGALEAHTETAKSPMRPRAVHYLPLPPLASAPAPMLMQLCSRCSEPRQARRRRPRLVSRRHEHAHGRCCVSLDEAQGQSRQSPGCPVRADATRACDTHTPGDAAGPRPRCFYYRGLFRRDLCAERGGSPDGLKAEELIPLPKKSQHGSLFSSSSQLHLK